METLVIEAANGRSELRFAPLARAGALVRAAVSGGRAALVCDVNTAALFGREIQASLEAADFEVHRFVLPAGEEAKRFSELEPLVRGFAEAGLTRDDPVVALGGGCVGDAAGFAAAITLRGVPLVMIPTTLLAQVDSAVGGKTGLNLDEGKNLVGSFYQPRLVLISPEPLAALPPRELRCGMAEIIKYGAICDAALFARLEAAEDDERYAPEVLAPLVQRSCELKAGYVERDPLDRGARLELNFGHTVGHALEHAAGYGMLTHGEAVSIGMVAAARLGVSLGRTPEGVPERLKALLTRAGLMTEIPTSLCTGDPLAPLARDKKGGAGGLRFVFLRDIGEASVAELDRQIVADYLETQWKEG